jgi:branched-chain amino acid transport system substrate-binding protein
MKRFKRALPRTGALLPGAFLLCWAGSLQAQTIKIGVQLPLTGERADVGKLMQNGLQMALEKANSLPGRKLELVWEDDQSDADAGVKAIEKLVNDPQVAAIAGEINSPFVMASKPLVEKQGVPYLTGGTSPRTTEQAQYIFRVAASDALLTAFMTKYVVEQLNLKSIAVLHDKTGIHNQRATMVVTVLKEKYGITPAVNASWAPGDRDFSSQIAQLKAAPVQAIIALGETPEGGPLFKQLKDAGIKAQVIAHRDFGAQKALDESAGGADGALIFTEYAPALQGQETKAWANQYRQRYGSDANVIAAQYYDALLLLAAAAKQGGPTRTGIKSGLESLKAFKGVMADYTFDAARNGAHRFFVAKVAGGKLTLAATLTE